MTEEDISAEALWYKCLLSRNLLPLIFQLPLFMAKMYKATCLCFHPLLFCLLKKAEHVQNSHEYTIDMKSHAGVRAISDYFENSKKDSVMPTCYNQQ